MKEADVKPFCALAGMLVDQLDTLLCYFL
jgi:hypothetical protein